MFVGAELTLNGCQLCVAPSVVVKLGEMAVNDRERLETTGSVCLGFMGIRCSQGPQFMFLLSLTLLAPVRVSEMLI